MRDAHEEDGTLKQRIMQALKDSRALVRDQIEYFNCNHSGQYADEDAACQLCEYGFECQWLYQNDEFVALERRSKAALLENLEFAVVYVDATVERWGHDRRTCRCETCCWLRDSRRLISELQNETD